MYRIMTKLHTLQSEVWRYYMIQDPQGQFVPYGTEDEEEVRAVALDILNRVGYLDLKIVEDKDYHLLFTPKGYYGPITDEDAKMVLDAIQYAGYGDIDVAKGADYELELVWGKAPQANEPTYSITFINHENGYFELPLISGIKEGGSVTNKITILQGYSAFHFLVDGVDCSTGLPNWLEYREVNGEPLFICKNITEDHIIEICVDDNKQ